MNSRFIRYVIALLFCALLQACNGGGSGVDVSGVAATGLALDGSVTLKDADGVTVSATIAQPSGAFSIDVAGLKSPFFLRASSRDGSTRLYSIATGSGTVNVNPLTHLIAVAAAMALDPLARTPDAGFNDPARFAGLTPELIRAATDRVMARMTPGFRDALASHGAADVDPLSDVFQVGNGLDAVFDAYVVSLNDASGEIQERRVADGAITAIGLVDGLGTFAAAGVYDGVVTDVAGLDHAVRDMIVTPAGEMRYVLDNGVQVFATLTAAGSTLSGAGKAYAPTRDGQPTGFRFADGATVVDLSFAGTLGSGTLTGTCRYGAFQETFAFSLNAGLTGIAASLERIVGTYVSSTESSDLFIGHIEPNGRIWGSGPGIAYSGLVQVVDPALNLYRVSLAYLKNGAPGQVSGLATFHEEAPAGDAIPMPAALIPEGYSGEVADLSFSQTVPVGHGRLALRLTGALKQVFIEAVRMSPQRLGIALRPTADSLWVQGLGSAAFSLTAAGDIQYSASSAEMEFSGSMTSTAGRIDIIANPGNVVLSGGGLVIEQGGLWPGAGQIVVGDGGGIVISGQGSGGVNVTNYLGASGGLTASGGG